jgi:hypothetical protein
MKGSGLNHITILIGILLVIGSCSGPDNLDYDRSKVGDPALFHASVKKLTDIMVHNTFSPPAASRVYAYPAIAAYEVIRQMDSTYQSLAGQMNEMPSIPLPAEGENISLPIAGIYAYAEVGKKLIFTESDMAEHQESLKKAWSDAGVPQKIVEASITYGMEVARVILDWADTDGYKETRTSPKYSFKSDPATWQPTPPAYMDGIEPHWREIRPFVLDSAQQFVPPVPTPFSQDKNSLFYKEVMEVYDAVANIEKEEVEIASFWDCNPYVMNQTGHVMFATKKITPGGHWVGITGIVCRKAGAKLVKTSEAYALTSIALADGFISCWDEKYRSNLVRPETYINEYIDEDWQPILQTPPFPEYTSGHSVISTAAAEALSSIFGEPFPFRDSTELEYGLPIRSFNSFREASAEAAISRLYGGIHYMPAIQYGVEQGKKVGEYVVRNIKMKK